MEIQKGQFWRTSDKRYPEGSVWIRFIFAVEGKDVHFLEYVPDGVVPYKGKEEMEIDEDDPRWVQLGVEEAKSLIVNMESQDDRLAFRLGKQPEVVSLAKALKILERRRVSSVDVRENVVRISTENGAEYEIALDREGYTSRQTCLPDPW